MIGAPESRNDTKHNIIKHHQSKGKLKMKHCKQAFTLIELLVVICIIAILASMLLPALQSARESASTATCINNLAQFGKAYQAYATDFNDYMPALTSTQGGSGGCGWETALINALGQKNDSSSPFRKAFFCDADASSDSTSSNKKSYSLNNLKEVVHPRIDLTLNANGGVVTGTGAGYMSGNKMTSVKTASDLITIGENVSEGNTFGAASFSSTSLNSPGSASAVHQQVSIYKRLTSHLTAGELYLDGHARHVKPQQTFPTKNGQTVGSFNISKKTTYNNSGPTGGATEGWGSWTDCPKRKVGDNCGDDTTCHQKK